MNTINEWLQTEPQPISALLDLKTAYTDINQVSKLKLEQLQTELVQAEHALSI